MWHQSIRCFCVFFSRYKIYIFIRSEAKDSEIRSDMKFSSPTVLNLRTIVCVTAGVWLFCIHLLISSLWLCSITTPWVLIALHLFGLLFCRLLLIHFGLGGFCRLWFCVPHFADFFTFCK